VKYGGESQIKLEQVDVQKSIDENTKRGVKFTLKPKPAIASTGSSAKPNSGRAAKPTALPPPPAVTTRPVVHSMPAAA
jgi:hypothetical protein